MLIILAEAAEILGVELQTVCSEGVLTRHAPTRVRRAYDHEERRKIPVAPPPMPNPWQSRAHT